MSFTTPRDWSVGELVTAAEMNTHIRDNLLFLKSNPVLSEQVIAAGTANVTTSGGGTVQAMTTGSVSIGSDVGAVYVEAWGNYYLDTATSGAHNNWQIRLDEASAGECAALRGYTFAGAGVQPAQSFYIRSRDLAWGGTSRTVTLNIFANAIQLRLLTTSVPGAGITNFGPVVMRIVRSY